MSVDLHIGSYRVLEHLATGGMGEVFRATSDAVDKPVALKVIRPEVEVDPQFRAMFESEARLCLSLSHANVVQTFEVGRGAGRLFLAMEHVDGLDLAHLLKAVRQDLSQPFPLSHALHIAVQALTGLDYAHRSQGPNGEPLGLVHRDVSPSNILLSCEGEVKIADFGVAKATQAVSRSSVGTLKGKLAYMAPEQVRGDALDARADVYAMGVVLYELVTGVRPFVGEGVRVIPDVLAGCFPRPGALRSDVPAPIEDIVLNAMAPDPADRYQSAAAMADWLREAAWQLGYVLSDIALGAFVRQVRELVPGIAGSDVDPEPEAEPTRPSCPRSLRPPPAL